VNRDLSLRESHAMDASGLRLVPEGVARPTSTVQVIDVVRECISTGTQITAAGSQTSTTGASITDRGVLLSLRAMDRVLDLDTTSRTIRVEAGALVGDVKRLAAEQGLLFAPDPTSEDSSTVGGAIACNASGARTLRYGATRAHVRAMTVVLANGEKVELRRTPLEKNTVGLHPVHDPIDWFVGSEGTFPARVTGLALPFGDEASALAFVVAARESALVPRCLEYFDSLAIELTRDAYGDRLAASGAAALVYAEDSSDDEPDLDAWLALAERHGAGVDDTRVFEGEGPLKEAREARHAVPSTMNERGARRREAGGRKVSTDWAVPYRRLAAAITTARMFAEKAGIEQAVTYGHAGNGHPHQNFIAHDAAELTRIESVVATTLETVIAMGGTVAAEHGIGKIKKKWLPLQLSPLQRGMMAAIKRELDPKGMFAPGNVM